MREMSHRKLCAPDFRITAPVLQIAYRNLAANRSGSLNVESCNLCASSASLSLHRNIGVSCASVRNDGDRQSAHNSLPSKPDPSGQSAR